MKKKINFAFATSQQTFTQPCPSPACQCQAPWLNPFCIFSGWLHQECVAFWCSWPLSVDWCPWGIRQFKNSPLCTSQKPGVVCISSGTGAWCETSILILGDTSSATCCCAALNIPEGRWWSKAESSSHAVARQGCSSKGDWKRGYPPDAALVVLLAPREEGLISLPCTWRAKGWVWSQPGMPECSICQKSWSFGCLLYGLVLSLSALSSLKLPLFIAFKASLQKCLALEEVCALVSYRCLLGYIWGAEGMLCRVWPPGQVNVILPVGSGFLP